MGAAMSTSVNTSSVLDEALTNVFLESSQTCDVSASTSQDLKFHDLEFNNCNVVFSDISQDMDLNQNFSCLQDTNLQADLLNKLKVQLDSVADAKVSGLPSALVTSTFTANINELKKKIVNNIDIKSIANCVASSISTQLQEYGKLKFNCSKNDLITFSNIRQEITKGIIVKCVQSQTTVAKASSELDAAISTTATSSNEGISIFGMIGVIIGIIILIVIVYVMYYFATKKSGASVINLPQLAQPISTPSPTPPTPPPTPPPPPPMNGIFSRPVLPPIKRM